MYLCLTRTGLYLSVEYCVTCVNLLFSNSRVQSYIKRGRLLDLHTEVQTVPPDEDVGHVGNVPVRRRWVQLARRPVIMIYKTTKSRVGLRPRDKLPAGISPSVRGMLYKERVRREQGVGAYLLNTADAY